jgi:hypothetical protein
VARVEESRGEYRVMMGKYEGKTHHGKPMPRWEDLKEVGWGHGVVSSGL